MTTEVTDNFFATKKNKSEKNNIIMRKNMQEVWSTEWCDRQMMLYDWLLPGSNTVELSNNLVIIFSELPDKNLCLFCNAKLVSLLVAVLALIGKAMVYLDKSLWFWEVLLQME